MLSAPPEILAYPTETSTSGPDFSGFIPKMEQAFIPPNVHTGHVNYPPANSNVGMSFTPPVMPDQALKATAALTKDSRPVGFVAPHEHAPNLGDTNIQRQNNSIVHLLVQVLQKLDYIEDKLQRLSDRVQAIERGKAEVSLPDDVINQLSQQLKGTLQVAGPRGAIKGKGKDAFRVWK